MAGVNKAIIVGHLGADPELRYTDSGSPVVNMSVATSQKWKDKSGNTKESTEWHRINVWGKQAENCKEYLQKGSLVYVEGRLQTRSWEDKNGVKRYTTEIVAQQVRFLNTKRSGNYPPPPTDDDAPTDFGDDDIPF